MRAQGHATVWETHVGVGRGRQRRQMVPAAPGVLGGSQSGTPGGETCLPERLLGRYPRSLHTPARRRRSRDGGTAGPLRGHSALRSCLINSIGEPRPRDQSSPPNHPRGRGAADTRCTCHPIPGRASPHDLFFRTHCCADPHAPYRPAAYNQSIYSSLVHRGPQADGGHGMA
jgi:hypothetical protein